MCGQFECIKSLLEYRGWFISAEHTLKGVGYVEFDCAELCLKEVRWSSIRSKWGYVEFVE